MKLKNVLIFSFAGVFVIFLTGCLGSNRDSVYQRAVFAAQAKVDLQETARNTDRVLNEYQTRFERIQFERLEGEFAQTAALIPSLNLNEQQLSDAIVRMYRQYGEQRSRLERELMGDRAKGSQIVSNIRAGALNIEAIHSSEEIRAQAESSYSEFLGNLIVNSGQRLVFEAEAIAAQRQADRILEQRLRQSSAPVHEEHHEPPVVVDPVQPSN